MTLISTGIGLGTTSSLALADIPPPLLQVLPPPGWSVGFSVSGDMATVTVSGSSGFDGSYAVALGDLQAGPVNLVPPGVTGVAGLGETLNVRPGLWVREGSGPAPAVSYQWRRDGTDIPGATGAAYLVQAADATTLLGVTETVAAASGTRAAASAGLAIPAPPVSLQILQLPDGSAEIQVAGDMATVTVSGSSGFDGSYAVALGDLQAGPVNLVPPGVTGVAGLGETLGVRPGLWVREGSGPAPAVSYQWRRDGTDIPGATGAAYLVQAADATTLLGVTETVAAASGTRAAASAGLAIPAPPVSLQILQLPDGSAEIQVAGDMATVTVSGSSGFDGSYAVALGDLQAGPVNLVPPGVTGVAGLGETLNVRPGLWVREGSGPAPAVSYQWRRDGTDIPGATGAAYLVQAADATTLLGVTETVAAASGTRAAASAGLAIPAPPVSLQILQLPDGSAEIQVAGDMATVTVSGSSGFDGSYAVALGDLQAGPVNLVPPGVTGVAGLGETLNVRPGLWVREGSGPAPAVSYQWRRDGTDIPGATGAAYLVQAADATTLLGVTETVAAASGTRAAASAGLAIPAPPVSLQILQLPDGTVEIQIEEDLATITISGSSGFDGAYEINPAQLDTGPVNLVPPVIAGDARTGETLSVQAGLWVYDGEVSAPVLTYQWQRDGAGIPGATGAAYVVQTADAGKSLRAAETATDANGARSMLSNALQVQQVQAPVFTPASLGSKLKLWLDFTDNTQMWQQIAKTTQVSAQGQAVGYVADKSGNGNDFDADTSTTSYTAAPTRSATGIAFGTTAILQAAKALTGVNGAGMRVYAVAKVPALIEPKREYALMGEPNSGNGPGITNLYSFGGGTIAPHAEVGAPVYMYDGTDVTPQPATRYALGQAWNDPSRFHVLGVRNLNLSIGYMNWGGNNVMKIFADNATSRAFTGGEARQFIITTDTLSAQELADLHAWLQTAAGP